MNVPRRDPVKLTPVEHKDADHWWRVHFEGDRRPPIILPSRKGAR
jgi:hypothetical protein